MISPNGLLINRTMSFQRSSDQYLNEDRTNQCSLNEPYCCSQGECANR